jgi:hypothetical protein
MRSLLRGFLGATLAVTVLVGLAWWLARGPRDGAGATDAPEEPVAAAPAPEVAAPPPRAASEPGADELAGTWEHVDMEAIRRALPDNLYWKMAAPSDDPAVAEERDAERARWNDAYGKVLSGTGSEEEIEAYFDQRHRLSSDYVEFTKYVLANYADELPAQDVALLELAQKLHLARLVELPRKLEEAHERKRRQDAAREAWLAEEREFAGQPESD